MQSARNTTKKKNRTKTKEKKEKKKQKIIQKEGFCFPQPLKAKQPKCYGCF
jgi:hypothetical protein